MISWSPFSTLVSDLGLIRHLLRAELTCLQHMGELQQVRQHHVLWQVIDLQPQYDRCAQHVVCGPKVIMHCHMCRILCEAMSCSCNITMCCITGCRDASDQQSCARQNLCASDFYDSKLALAPYQVEAIIAADFALATVKEKHSLPGQRHCHLGRSMAAPQRSCPAKAGRDSVNVSKGHTADVQLCYNFA